MTFRSPEILHALWALPLIPLFYLVRRRARAADVPHLFLWAKVLARGHREKRSRLKEILAILLNIVVATSIIAAAADPVRKAIGEGRGRTLLIVQNSLSTAARTPRGQTRLFEMVRAAEARLPSLIDDGQTALFSASAETVSLVAPTFDTALLRGALEKMTPTLSPLDLEALASAVKKSTEREDWTRIVFLTDGTIDPAAKTDGLELFSDVIVMNDASSNVGIMSIDVSVRGTRAVLEVGVAAFGKSAARKIVWKTADERVLADRTFECAADGETVVELSATIDRPGLTTVDLEFPEDRPHSSLDDVFATDDRAWVEIPADERARVLLVAARADEATKACLAALDDAIDLDAAGFADPRNWRNAGTYDLYILENVEEGEPLPPGVYLLLNSYAPKLPLDRGDIVEGVEIVDQAAGDVVLRGVDLRNLTVKKAASVKTTAGAVTLVAASSGALFSRGEVGDAKFVHVAFDAGRDNSSLKLLPAFPLLVKDTLDQLWSRPRRLFPATVKSGGTLVARRPAETSGPWSLGKLKTPIDPATASEIVGWPTPLAIEGPGPILRIPRMLGPALVFGGKDPEAVGVALLDRRKSDVSRRIDPKKAPVTPSVGRLERDESTAVLFVAAALAVLLFEWGFLLRRGSP